MPGIKTAISCLEQTFWDIIVIIIIIIIIIIMNNKIYIWKDNISELKLYKHNSITYKLDLMKKLLYHIFENNIQAINMFFI